jgi:hypothetical protein
LDIFFIDAVFQCTRKRKRERKRIMINGRECKELDKIGLA